MQDENPLVFPKQKDKARRSQYQYYDKLYFGDHFEAFSIRGEKDFSRRYNKLRYVVANFPGLMSRVMADMLFGEAIVFDAKDKNNQIWLDGWMEQNELITQLYESALGNSRRGDSVFKLRIGPIQNNPTAPSTVIVEEISPEIYFPVFDVNAARYKTKADVLAYTFEENGKCYLHKETHTAGYIQHEIFMYDKETEKIVTPMDVTQFGFQQIEETRASTSLIFHVPNVRDGSGYFGTSDYKDLETLFFALNNRITKVDNILDKHSDPILAVPAGVIDENGQIRKEALGMFEVDNENPGFNKPEYIVWNANLQSAFDEIDRLIELSFMFSEISPSAMGITKEGGQAESGRALKFKLIRTIAKRNRKKLYYDVMLKKLIYTAMELGKNWGIKIDNVSVSAPEKITIDWGNGIIRDETEETDTAIKRIDSETLSRSDAIARLDNISPDDAKKKIKEIEAENSISSPPSLDKTQPGHDSNMPTNQPTGNSLDAIPTGG